MNAAVRPLGRGGVCVSETVSEEYRVSEATITAHHVGAAAHTVDAGAYDASAITVLEGLEAVR